MSVKKKIKGEKKRTVEKMSKKKKREKKMK